MRCLICVVVFNLTCSLIPTAIAQSGVRSAAAKRIKAEQKSKEQIEALKKRLKQIADRQTSLPIDPALQAIQKEFIAKTEKLAQEYERKKDFEKARDAYQSIIRLAPNYLSGHLGLSRILSGQTSEDKRVVSVMANKGWQDSGASLVAGMPAKITVQGTWTVSVQSGFEGIEIPKEQRPRDDRIRYGTLIGVIIDSPAKLDDAKPIRIFDGKEFIVEQSGRLFLRMFDIEPRDNDGKLMVMIQSTFEK